MLAFIMLIFELPDVQNHRFFSFLEKNHDKCVTDILKCCELSLTFQNSEAYPKFIWKTHVLKVVKKSHQELISGGFQDFIISCVFWLDQKQEDT